MLKGPARIIDAPARHWVGDGFHVRSIFSYQEYSELISPFLLLDYAEPSEFRPSTRPRGVGEHPHRGFETVTLVYSGEVTHRDSSGGGGTIMPGDVQWMTAAGGIIHEEFHSEAFSRAGGTMEMVQLWVNLPASDKMAEPRYQALTSAEIPRVSLGDDDGVLRVIAGSYGGERGPAQTATSLNLWDIAMRANSRREFRIPDGHNSILVVRRGEMTLGTGEVVSAAQAVLFEKGGTTIGLVANSETEFLLLSGEPIDEPVVGYGPFVMNSEQEIRDAILDFNNGRFARIARSDDRRVPQ